MCTWQYVVFIVAMATIFSIASSLDTQHGSSVQPRSRRFLFSTQYNVNMCNMFCPLVCPQGFVLSPNGCFLCQCASIGSQSATISPDSSTVQNILQPYSQINGGVFLYKPCNPAIRHCRLQCTIGYLEGSNGCQYCICQSTITNHVTTTVSLVPTTTGQQVASTTMSLSTRPRVTMAPSTRPRITRPPLTRPSTTLSPLTRPSTSLSQSTRPRVTMAPSTRHKSTLPPLTRPRVTTIATRPTIKSTSTTVTTQRSTKPASKYNDPCISSQQTCDKPCGGNYVKGPGWCQYCLCAKKTVQDLQTTTIAPGTMSGKLATIPHYLDLSPTSEACIMAKVICNQKCDHGFVSHPDDCLYCSCKNQDDVAANDDPDSFYVTLPNPCVKDTTTCGIMCLNGYVMGPRDCEFCSCRN